MILTDAVQSSLRVEHWLIVLNFDENLVSVYFRVLLVGIEVRSSFCDRNKRQNRIVLKELNQNRNESVIKVGLDELAKLKRNQILNNAE